MVPKKFSNNKNRPNYKKYDDVFISRKNTRRNDIYEDEQRNMLEEQYQDDINSEYFSQKKQDNILNEKMIRYQKRELPPLQRYDTNNNRREMGYDEYRVQSYWDEKERGNYRKDYNDESFFKSLSQKFLVIFCIIVSLVCIVFIIYNWESRTNKNNPSVVINPEMSSFKILPDNPGGINISHQDKTIYGYIGNSKNSRDNYEQETILPPAEAPSLIDNNDIDEYSIIDDRVYYIKLATSKNKNTLKSEINNAKIKYRDKIEDTPCSIHSVRDKNGEKKYAALIGPFEQKDTAISVAKKLETNCSIVAVKIHN